MVGRVERLPRNGSYFTKELAVAKTSAVVVRGMDGEIRAFHNMCRHRGNKLVWTDDPGQEVSGNCRQFICKYHGWKYDLEGRCAFVQQESEFFDLDKADYGLASVHCEGCSRSMSTKMSSTRTDDARRRCHSPTAPRRGRHP
jgi:phenylpropionate dioxygenase-like ring-hydroxylating dioxygenase large terminal subunit